jgi:hypothetical protein
MTQGTVVARRKSDEVPEPLADLIRVLASAAVDQYLDELAADGISTRVTEEAVETMDATDKKTNTHDLE